MLWEATARHPLGEAPGASMRPRNAPQLADAYAVAGAMM